MKRLALVSLFFALPLFADFSSAELALRAQLGHQQTIPLLGFVRFASNIVHPKGVHDFQLAVFERGGMTSENAVALMRRETNGFSQIVHHRSKRESTLIYARPTAAGRMEVLILNSDQHETVLLRCDVDAAQFARDMRKHERLERLGR